MATLEGHSSTVYSVAFHPTESILATGSEDKTVKLWRFSPSGSVVICVETLDKHIASVRSVAFHTKVPLLATGSKDHTAKIWELNIQNIQNIYMSDDGTKVIRIKENLLKPK
jgi:WD40 repeat protein